jgi:hypothetical protein
MPPKIMSLIVMLVISLYPKAKGETASQTPAKTWKIIQYRRLPILFHLLLPLGPAILFKFWRCPKVTDAINPPSFHLRVAHAKGLPTGKEKNLFNSLDLRIEGI